MGTSSAANEEIGTTLRASKDDAFRFDPVEGVVFERFEIPVVRGKEL